MVLINALPKMPLALAAAIDALLVGVLALPLIYFFFYRPLRKQAEAQHRMLAHWQHHIRHDPLTGLGNLDWLREKLQTAIDHAQAQRQSFAFILIDINRLNDINATFGHRTGDELLVQIAQRLRQLPYDHATVARIGGDEFGMLLPLQDEDPMEPLLETIKNTMTQAYTVNGIAVSIDICMGVTVFPQHGADPDVLLQRSDVAKRHAKKTYSSHSVYCKGKDPYNIHRLIHFSELQQTLHNNQWQLFYQPKAEVGTLRVHAVEALLRWQHPRRGLLPPCEFIALAEQSELIIPVTYWVLKTALNQIVQWQMQGFRLNLAVNISAKNLCDDNLPAKILELLQQTHVPAGRLTLEITESALMSDPQQSLDVLIQLKKMGLGISIDDFGTGFSSLAYLSRLPADELKIDKSFIVGLAQNTHDSMIVHSTIDLAHNLGLRVTAEGVESQSVLERLSAWNCDHIQGFQLCKPLPADALSAWLRDHHSPRLLALH